MRQEVFEHILKVEGEKYTNHPSDRGGATKFGVTQRLLNEYLEVNDAPYMDVRFLSKPLAKDVYSQMKWKPALLDQVYNATHALIFFDQFINQHPHIVVERLQRSLNRCLRHSRLKVDGILGPKTLEAFNRAGKSVMIDFIQESQVYYASIARSNPSQLVFLVGWLKRTHRLWRILDFGL